MGVGLTHSDVSERRRGITVDEYHRMIDAGTLGEDEQRALASRRIVNLAETTVEVHRDPDLETGAYRARVIVSSEDTLAATSVPGLRIAVADIFP